MQNDHFEPTRKVAASSFCEESLVVEPVAGSRVVDGSPSEWIAWAGSDRLAVASDCPIAAAHGAIKRLRDAREDRPLRKRAERLAVCHNPRF